MLADNRIFMSPPANHDNHTDDLEMSMRTLVLVPFLIACSSSGPDVDAGNDASVDVTTNDANDASDAGVTGCDVQTCSGPTFLTVGQSVPTGDICGNTCSCTIQGGFLIGQCTFGSDCPCADASTD